MFILHIIIIVVVLVFGRPSNGMISSCIPKTTCQCQFIRQSFLIVNCGYSLPDLPILNSKMPINITEIIAREALVRWPLHACYYSSLERLDLSGSFFDARHINLDCLPKLIYLNLSRTHLTHTPTLSSEGLKLLEIFDLSNNDIQLLDGYLFRSLKKLKILSLENNPLKRIDRLNQLFALPHIEVINLINRNSTKVLRKPLNVSQWISLARQWNGTNRSLTIHSNSIPLQMILPSTIHLTHIPLHAMHLIFQTLAHSTFTAPAFTPKCHCRDLRVYQRIFSFVDDHQTLSPLFRSSTCRMPNGIIHARLFDQAIFTHFNCSNLAKISSTSSKPKTSSSVVLSVFFPLALLVLCFI